MSKKNKSIMNDESSITNTEEDKFVIRNSQTRNSLIPELRFPEFKELDNWQKKKLADVADLKNGYAFKSSSYVEPGKYGIVTIGNVQKGRLATDSIKKIDKVPDDVQRHQILQIGDILISMTGNVGRTCLVNEQNLLLNQRVGKIIPESILPNYLYQYTQRNQFIQNLQRKAVGGAQGNISTSDIHEILLPVPKDIQEQQKIASCLSSLDELIAAHKDKLDALKDHKKGLLQNLFPREGETVPKIRFPEFEGDGEWVESNIQSLLDNKIIISHLDGNHGALYPRAEEFSEDGVPYLTANDFISGTVDFRFCKHLPLERAKKFKKGVAKNGDILFAHNATVGPVAKLITDLPFVILSTTATYYRCDNESLINDFLRYALESPFFVAQYTRVMSQSTRNQVPITTQRKFNLQLPAPMEQQKIASCLSAVDELITAQQEKIEQLHQHKKGLMQGLFPNSTKLMRNN